jgi:hypothetical protein
MSRNLDLYRMWAAFLITPKRTKGPAGGAFRPASQARSAKNPDLIFRSPKATIEQAASAVLSGAYTETQSPWD